jgi:AsmA protein
MVDTILTHWLGFTTVMKKALLITIGILVLLLVAIVLIPPLIDLGAYKGRYLPLVEQALQRKVDVGEIRLRIVPAPAIRLSKLSVLDDPSFSKEPFFTAQSVSLRLRLGPLLKGKFQVEEFIVEKPAVHLVKKPDGTFNFADLAKKKQEVAKKEKKEAAPGPKEAARLSQLVPALLRVEDGSVTLQTEGQKPLQLGGIDVSLKDFSATHPFPYRVALKAPGLKPISLEGALRYQETPSTLTLKDSRLKAEDVEFGVSGAVADLTGAPKVNLTLANDNFDIKPIAQLLAAAAIAPKELEASGPVGLRVALAGPSNNLLSQIQVRLKRLKVNDSRAFKGTVAGEIDLTAPLGGGDGSLVRKARGNGRLGAKDGELTNVDLVKKIEQITGLIGMSKQERGGATTFKTLETEFALAGGVAAIKRIYLQSPVMEAQGNGKMNLEPPTLDLALETALAADVSARVDSGKATTLFKDSQGRLVVPLKITGPAKSPAVNLDSAKLMKKGLGQMLEERGKGSALDRLFKRK